MISKYVLTGVLFLSVTLVVCACASFASEDLVSLLVDASKAGDTEKVESLITRGADVNGEGRSGQLVRAWTPLYAASCEGHLAVVRLLVAKGAKVNRRHFIGYAPLHAAAGGGYLEIMRHLIAHGADVNIGKGMEPDPSSNKKMKKKPEPAGSGSGGIDIETLVEHTDIMDQLLEKAASDPRSEVYHRRRDLGETPLHMAAFEGQVEAMRLLLDNGAKIESMTVDGITPLHRAASEGHLKAVIFLISKGADINARDKDGVTPLGKALAAGHENVVEFLRMKGGRK